MLFRSKRATPGGVRQGLLWVFFWGLAAFQLVAVPGARAAPATVTAFISDAWWDFQQDCNGDGCNAGTLPGDHARLNWGPAVTNCNGTLTVFEVVSVKPCASNTWSRIYTNAAHAITGCSSAGQQYLDVAMAGGCDCRDYQIEIYRAGESVPDSVRSGQVDADLYHHQEQGLADDFCLSDFFASCAALNGPFGSQADNNVNATKEPGEPDHAGSPGGHSMWYCWTAPNTNAVTFDTLGSGFDTVLAVYTGSSVSNLSLVASNDDIAGATNRQSSVSFTPASGVTYHVAVDGFGDASGNFRLNWNQTGSALPDLIVWGPAASPAILTRTFASGDCEVLEGCATVGQHRLLTFGTETRNIGAGDLAVGNPSTNSLFSWASCHQHYHFERYMEYSLLDTNGNAVGVGHKVGFCIVGENRWSPTADPQQKYNCDNQGIQVGWSDIYNGTLPCQYIDITSVPPGEYLLQQTVNPDNLLAEADTSNNTTLVPVTIPPSNCTSAPANDDFSNALPVTSTPFSYTEFNQCAGKEFFEPNHAGDSGGHSVWFDWTAPSNQTAVVTTKGSDFDTLLAVYTGSSLSSLSVVASNDDIITGVYRQSQVSFPATSGTTYHIAVDGWDNSVGTVVVNVIPPGNDDFADAYPISGVTGQTKAKTLGATKEPYEPAHAFDVGGHSIWYDWLAPVTGLVDFNTAGSSYDTTLAVYIGTAVTNLTLLAANNDDYSGVTSQLAFPAISGTHYKIAVDGYGGALGDVVLNWNMLSTMGIVGLSNGQVQIDFTGVNGQRYGLLGSSNLETWATQTIRTMSHSSQQVIDTPGGGARFYRTVLTP